MFFYILFTFLVLIFAHYYWKNADFYRYASKIPGPKGYPLIGNLLDFGFSPVEIYNSISTNWRKYGMKTFKFMIGPDMMVFLSTPENIEFICTSNVHLDKSTNYKFLGPWLGEGILTASGGTHWQTHRKIITPAFHFKILENYVDIFVKEANILAAMMLKRQNEEGSAEAYSLVSLATLDSICETAMGLVVRAQENDTQCARAVLELCEALHLRMFNPFLIPDTIFNNTGTGKMFFNGVKVMHSTTDEVLRKRKQQLKDEIQKLRSGVKSSEESRDELGMKKKLDFVDLLLLSSKPDGSAMTDKQVNDEVNTFLFAGHDTTTSGIAFGLFVLAKHPNIQEKIVEEQKQLLGHDYSEPLTLKVCQEMKYLERVIKEIMRVYPPVPIFGRSVKTTTEFPDGTIIPAGALIALAPMLINQNPKYFPEPEKFDPDRFLYENTRDLHTYAYVPFSAGPRNCIGQKFAMLEMKCTLAVILQKLILREVKGFEPIITADITLKSQNGLKIMVEKRE